MKPARRLSRRRYWHREIRTERDLRARLRLAMDYLSAMVAAGQRTIPRATVQEIEAITEHLVSRADALAKAIPAQELNKGGKR